MLRLIIVSVLLTALVAGAFYLFTPEGRQFIDRVTINWDRQENRGHFRAGRPLPGTPVRGRPSGRPRVR